MLIDDGSVWAGTETGLHLVRAAEEGMAAKLRAGGYGDDEKDDEEGPRLLEVSDGVATIAIKGPLVNSDSPYLEYFGVTGYPEIREAIIAAAEDPEVTHIVLDVDSGGGAVSGVDDTAKLIRMVNDRVKPVTTYADNMASAAYWLGCAAGEVYAGKASMVGSIGVIATFKEISERNKMEGITATVVRAGKHKALANPNEKLTPAAEAQIQKMVNAAYGIFVDHVATMRGKSYAHAESEMADGKEFIGQEAVDVGLLDGITTFDELMSMIKQKSIDSSINSMDNRGKNSLRLSGATSTTLLGEQDMAKKALTEQHIAALAAGIPLDAISASIVEAPVVEGETSVEAPTAATDVEASAEVVAPVVEASVENHDKIDATVQLLSNQLKEKDADLIQAHIKIAKLEEASAEALAAQGPLLGIAAKSISNMNIALGGSAFNVDGLNATQVLAEHDRLSVRFQASFKSGGVAAVSGDVSAKNETVVGDSLMNARLAAVRFSK